MTVYTRVVASSTWGCTVQKKVHGSGLGSEHTLCIERKVQGSVHRVPFWYNIGVRSSVHARVHGSVYTQYAAHLVRLAALALRKLFLPIGQFDEVGIDDRLARGDLRCEVRPAT